ncbi:MAG TPA: sigma-70 family RNA polymerase sigma factor [Acidimicrobiales bacterium]
MTQPAENNPGRAALDRLVRDEWPRVLASLVRSTGSFQLAEDALQDTVVRALDLWSNEGVPPEPRAWLIVAARRRAVDLLRREGKRTDKERASIDLLDRGDEPIPETEELGDDVLRLLFTCCHPTLAVETQTALALRSLCGLTTAEVARALLMSEAAMAKRLVRARQKIAVAGIPFRVPGPKELPQRLQGVLSTIYLLFNEGYHATAGEHPLRHQLTSESIRLAALVDEVLPGEVAVIGLRSLLYLQDARSTARLDAEGELVGLPDQDRSLWDLREIRAGMSLLGVALHHPSEFPHPYVAQAAIAACHDIAPTWEATNWAAIVSWYDALVAVADTPVVRLNRAIAIGELEGPSAGLAELERIEHLTSYPPFVTARAELLARAGRDAEARAEFRAAIELPGNDATKRELVRRLAESVESNPRTSADPDGT